MRENNQNYRVIRDEPKLTGQEWNNKFYKLKFTSFEGFSSENSYLNDKIDRITFLNRASICKIELPEKVTRKSAQEYKRKLNGN